MLCHIIAHLTAAGVVQLACGNPQPHVWLQTLLSAQRLSPAAAGAPSAQSTGLPSYSTFLLFSDVLRQPHSTQDEAFIDTAAILSGACPSFGGTEPRLAEQGF